MAVLMMEEVRAQVGDRGLLAGVWWQCADG